VPVGAGVSGDGGTAHGDGGTTRAAEREADAVAVDGPREQEQS
jgi:hypothetical protein